MKFWTAFTKFIGPNTLHVLDALAAIAITAGVGIVTSPGFSDFVHKHTWASALIALGPVIGVPLAAKLRKAAGAVTFAQVTSISSLLAPVAKEAESAIHIHLHGTAAKTVATAVKDAAATAKPAPAPDPVTKS